MRLARDLSVIFRSWMRFSTRFTQSWWGRTLCARILPLDNPGDIPPEEKTEDFIAALQQAKVSDIEYLAKLQALEATGHDDEIHSRNSIESFGNLSAPILDCRRVQKNEINRATHARSLGVEPGFELPPKAGKKST